MSEESIDLVCTNPGCAAVLDEPSRFKLCWECIARGGHSMMMRVIETGGLIDPLCAAVLLRVWLSRKGAEDAGL